MNRRMLLTTALALWAAGSSTPHLWGMDESPEGEVTWEPTRMQLLMHQEATERRGNLPAQELDEECCRIAQRWAEWMARNHTMRHGGGEQIIAMGYRSVSACFNGWMGSSGHRAWVLSRSPRCGWGAAQSANGTWFYAGCFRGRASVIEREVERSIQTPTRSVYQYRYVRRPRLLRWRRW